MGVEGKGIFVDLHTHTMAWPKSLAGRVSETNVEGSGTGTPAYRVGSRKRYRRQLGLSVASSARTGTGPFVGGRGRQTTRLCSSAQSQRTTSSFSALRSEWDSIIWQADPDAALDQALIQMSRNDGERPEKAGFRRSTTRRSRLMDRSLRDASCQDASHLTFLPVEG
jgi:hypothetical protein